MNTYIVTYDICHPKRLRAVFQILKGWGEHLQYSVFACELNAVDLMKLKISLDEKLKHDEDQVLFFDLGPVEGRGSTVTASLGLPYQPPERGPRIV